MRVVGLPSSFYHLSRHLPLDLSPKAQERLRWLSCFKALREQGLSSSKASEVLGIPRSNLYRWLKRLKEQGVRGLEEQSRRPKRQRHPTFSPELAQAVLRLREEYPRWGKDKLVVLLRRQGYQVSTSMVGRILGHLRRRGELWEPLLIVSAGKRRLKRAYGVRKPKGYPVEKPGDLVQVDTLDLRPLPGVVLKHFTARDVISRWDVVAVHTRATATTAAAFLDTLQARMPFKIKAIQVDGGSEFMGQFEEACREQGIRLFVLPPRSPKLNGCVERAHRTHTEEFYEVVDSDFTIADLREKLIGWEEIYNTVRPHQALDWMTPQEYLRERHLEMAHLSHM